MIPLETRWNFNYFTQCSQYITISVKLCECKLLQIFLILNSTLKNVNQHDQYCWKIFSTIWSQLQKSSLLSLSKAQIQINLDMVKKKPVIMFDWRQLKSAFTALPSDQITEHPTWPSASSKEALVAPISCYRCIDWSTPSLGFSGLCNFVHSVTLIHCKHFWTRLLWYFLHVLINWESSCLYPTLTGFIFCYILKQNCLRWMDTPEGLFLFP